METAFFYLLLDVAITLAQQIMVNPVSIGLHRLPQTPMVAIVVKQRDCLLMRIVCVFVMEAVHMDSQYDLSALNNDLIC